MPKNKTKLQCPKCGSNQYSVQNAGGETTTFILCKKCGNKGTPKAWQNSMAVGDSFNLASLISGLKKTADEGMGGTSNQASSRIPEEQEIGKKTKPKEEKGKVNNKREEVLRGEDPEVVDPKAGGKIKSMGDKNMTFNLTKISELNGNKSFNLNKVALVEKYTKEQQERRDLGKNMVMPEGNQDIDSDGKDNKDGEKSDKYTSVEENRRFDTVDRKDMHSSPDPRVLIPGYKAWYNREVDKYYDGWVDDHIENSGGKVVGSNTEKTMNLKDEERYHAPVYPTEAPTEKMLETRHHFDEGYTRAVASNADDMKKESGVKKK